MKKGFVIILVISMVSAISLIPRRAITNSAAAPPGNTGAYGSPSCEFFYCHGGVSQLVPGWITSDVPTIGYMADSSYQVSVFVADSGRFIFGFECSPMDSMGQLLGTLLENQSTTLVGSGQYITHNAGSIFSLDSNSWTFEWVAPSQGTGDVTFFASMNAANGDGTMSGDIIYHSTMTIMEDTLTPVVGINEHLGPHISVFPNPATDHLFISLDGKQVFSEILLINLAGQSFMISYEQAGSLKLSLNDVPNGVYLVSVDGVGGSRVVIAR